MRRMTTKTFNKIINKKEKKDLINAFLYIGKQIGVEYWRSGRSRRFYTLNSKFDNIKETLQTIVGTGEEIDGICCMIKGIQEWTDIEDLLA